MEANGSVTNYLSLIQSERLGGGGKTHRLWLDFVIDGSSLHDAADLQGSIGCLGWGPPDFELLSIRQLQRKAPAPIEGNRVMLYVCPECGDLGCGAFTTRVARDGDVITWSDFAFENDYEPVNTDDDSYAKIGPFHFNSQEYWQTFEARALEITS